MIREFVTIFALTVTLAPCIAAQQTPATPPATDSQQTSATPQTNSQTSSSGQETSDEEVKPRHRARPLNYDKWTYDVGVGGSLPNGTTKTFVRGGGFVGQAGIARNSSRILGLRLDFSWAQLPLRDSALELAQATSASSHVYTINLDPIVNVPVTRTWGGYILAGPSFFHRTGELSSSTAVPGGPCNPFWTWWGRCSANSIALNGSFVRESQNEFGANFGAGVTRKIVGKYEFFAEFRYEHGSHNRSTTDYRPITIGVRW
jgi:Outer membrane protein beta-barrel domain